MTMTNERVPVEDLEKHVDEVQQILRTAQGNLPTFNGVPEHGEQAAKAVEDMADRRATFMERFADERLKQVQADTDEQLRRVHADLMESYRLADAVRSDAAEEAHRIRKKTARYHMAGLRVVDAYEEFMADNGGHEPPRLVVDRTKEDDGR